MWARARRGLYWAGVLAAIVALAVGGVLAYLGYSATSGPAGTVRAYYAALQRGDAATALAYGDLPRGPHALLTAAVLREQQRVAAIGHVRVVSVDEPEGTAADTATVTVRYALGFAAGAEPVVDQVPVHRVGDTWRLSATAVPVTIELDRASQRATIAGTAVPAGRTLLFPGAVPVTFDTPYLELAGGSVSFTSPGRVELGVQVSAAGRAAVAQALGAALRECLATGSAGSCPLPSDRYVPGSLHGTLTGSVAANMSLAVGAESAGVIDVSGTVGFHGSYRKLNFDNVASRHTGTIRLPLSSVAYAVDPVRLRWTGPS